MAKEPVPVKEEGFVPWVAGELSDDERRSCPIQDEELVSWRMPPEESFSDWAIEIIRTDDESTHEASQKETLQFHVHKVFLAVGPKKSLYFQRIFQNQNFQEAETKTSRIELNSVAASAFPCMLDYLYSAKHVLDITTENAAALHYLGQYFDIPRLRAEAIMFCERNLHIFNCAMYYEHAKLFNDESIMRMVAFSCFIGLDKIGRDADIMKSSDVALWRNVVHMMRVVSSLRTKGLSKHLSRLIATFCALQREPVSAEEFIYLTDPIHMMEVDNDVAVQLLQLEGDILPERNTCQTLSNLQYRCIEAITDCWECINVQAFQRDLSGLNPGLILLAFDRALDKAKHVKREKDRLETLLCQRIIVQGAGITECNGTYTRTDEIYHDAPCFRMETLYNDEPFIFVIHLERALEGGWCWALSREEEDDSFTFVYFTTTCRGPEEFPPTSGWHKENATAEGGVPTLSLFTG